MKILLVSHFFPPNRIGGAEKITQMYAASLMERGHCVQVLCAGDWDTGDQHWNGFSDEVYQGIPVRRVNLNWVKAKDSNRCLYDNPASKDHLDQWLDDWQPDVVHIVSLITLSISVIRAVKKRGIPVVFTLVDFWLVCPKNILVRGDQSLCDGKSTSRDCLKCLMCGSNAYMGLKRILSEEVAIGAIETASRHPWVNHIRGLRGMALNIDERRSIMAEVIQQVDCVIAPSAFLGNIIEGVGLLPKPATLIHYGHDLSWVTDMPEKRPTECVRIGYIGQIIPLKGLHVLIAAFQIASTRGNTQLLIYGDPHSSPKYTAQLKQMIGESKNIRFMGAYAHAEIGQVLSGLDIIVVPSQWHENNPLVVQEAFASLTPVIGSNVGGISAFIQHDVNGLLFEHDSVSDLQTQIERTLTEPGLIRHLQSGIGPVKTIREEMDEIIEIYQTLIPQPC